MGRYLAQVAIAVPRVPGRPLDPDVDYWVTVCRKVLQRGVRPPLSARAEESLGPAPLVGDADESLLSLASLMTATDLDPSYDLHPRWERPFWERARELAPRAAAWLIPQAPLEALIAGDIDVSVGRRWVDFLYAPPGGHRIVFEIDGLGHVRRADADRARDRQLSGAGVRVLRADGRASLDHDSAMLSTLVADEQRYATGSPLMERLARASAPARLALAVVESVESGLLPKGGPWSLEVVDPSGAVERVAGAALDPLRAVSELWHLNVVPPVLQINGRAWYLSGTTSDHVGGPVRMAPQIRIRVEPGTPYWSSLAVDADIPTVTLRPAGVPADLAWLPSVTSDRRAMRLTEDTDLHLHLLMADLFGHTSFREGQLPSLHRSLRGGDSVVLLPTGTGKSLIYQMAGLLMPGTTVVVDPLVSLIDDQEARLVRDGIDRVAAVHASRAGGSRTRDATLDSVARGEPLFLFVTPERLQNQRFRDNLRETAERQLINLTVIDEAHTVSEWGHDFRTSYLRMARNLRRLCRDQRGLWPPMLALTGTAGPAVLRDVLRELEIDGEDEEALQKPRSSDRPNLHYLTIAGRDTEWLALIRRAITGAVPEALGVELSELAAVRGSDTFSGIVFCPWAGGEHGVDRVRDEVVGAFAERSIALPTATYTGKVGAERRAQAAEEFKENRVPLLVATKAFGMGIDKPNIRYTIHAGFPSSIEAFAQEAGRAGRDGRDAYCVLTTALPDPDTAQQLLDRSIANDERRSRNNRTRDANGGDLKRQIFFYSNAFPGSEEEAELGLRLFDWLSDRGGEPGGSAVIAIHPRKDEKPADHERRKARYDRALFRLACLGVVSDLTVDGPEITVHFSDYDHGSVDDALLSYLSRIEPGAEAVHRTLVETAPEALAERVGSHLHTLADAVYRIVASARLNAIENMYELAMGDSDPEHIRSRINAYLGDGVAATILARAISVIDVPRFVASLEALPLAETGGLVGATARQREAYPEHPVLWFATAFAEAREAKGDVVRFSDALRRSLANFSGYGVDQGQAAAGVTWLVSRLRTENGGKRWGWTKAAMDAWDASGFDPGLLEPAEDEALRMALRGSYREEELAFVIRRRLWRRAGDATSLAGRYAGASTATAPEERR